MRDTTAGSRRLFFAIFTISGFSGLIYEAIWSHYLKLFLGHAAYAQTLVLAIFMGGMALGSWVMARYSTRIPNLLLGYAIVEGIIGLLGLVFHPTSVGATSWVFESVLPQMDSATAAQAVKWSVGALLILPQSILLGMTFPLMSGAIVRRFPERSGETLAMLYFTNSLGAALGVLVSGFVLIGIVGLPGTIMTAGLMNVALALFVWGIMKYQPTAVQSAAPSVEPNAGSAAPVILRWMLLGATLTGTAAFFYEIAWIRMLSLVLGSSTHSFEMMLSAFILGIALGGLWIHRRIDSLKNPVKFLSVVLLIMAGIALLSLPIYNATFDVMSLIVGTFSPSASGYVGYNISSHLIAMAVMMPTTFFCGMTLPIITHILIRNGTGERAIGSVYAWNTAGAIVGVIAAVHFLMPAIGVKGVIITGAAIQVLLAVLFGALAPETNSGIRGFALPGLAGAAAVIVAATTFDLDPTKMASGVFRHGRAAFDENEKILFLQHGKTASISLVDSGGVISIATNGKPDAAIQMKREVASPDEITMIMAGAIPLALHPNPARVATIGFGSGLTSSVLLASPAVQELDTIEIEPLMVKAAHMGFMPRVKRTFEDPRSHIKFEDAKTFFAVNRKKYDVIVSEPSNPWVSGVATLFSQEFYRQITRYLEPDGMLVQWIQTYEADLDILNSIMKALAPEFSDFAVYNADLTNIIVVATRAGSLRSPNEHIFEYPELKAELARVGITSINDFNIRFLGNKRLFGPVLRASGIPANSDYFPFVDLNAPRTRIMKRNAVEFAGLQTLPLPYFELLTQNPRKEGVTVASPRPSTTRDTLVAQAVALRDAIETSHYDKLAPESARALLTLSVSEQACSAPGVRRTWLSSAFYVARRTSSSLSVSELQNIWENIARSPCASLLEGPDRQMFALLRAVGARDAARIAEIGKDLFESKYSFAEPGQMQFALLATATAAVVTGQPDLALEVIREHGDPRTQSAAMTLGLQWLVSMALEQSDEKGATGVDS